MRTTVNVSGMQCDHCKRAVFTSLTPVAGIRWADVQLGTVTVEHDGQVTIDALREAIAASGYVVTGGTEEGRILPTLDAEELDP